MVKEVFLGASPSERTLEAPMEAWTSSQAFNFYVVQNCSRLQIAEPAAAAVCASCFGRVFGFLDFHATASQRVVKVLHRGCPLCIAERYRRC